MTKRDVMVQLQVEALEFVDATSNKFWRRFIVEGSTITHWGRRGTAGQVKVHPDGTDTYRLGQDKIFSGYRRLHDVRDLPAPADILEDFNPAANGDRGAKRRLAAALRTAFDDHQLREHARTLSRLAWERGDSTDQAVVWFSQWQSETTSDALFSRLADVLADAVLAVGDRGAFVHIPDHLTGHVGDMWRRGHTVVGASDSNDRDAAMTALSLLDDGMTVLDAFALGTTIVA